MSIRIAILGADREKSEELFKETIKAVTGLPVITELSRVQDAGKIKKYNVPETPALVINEKVKSSGRVPPKEEIRAWLKEEYMPEGRGT